MRGIILFMIVVIGSSNALLGQTNESRVKSFKIVIGAVTAPCRGSDLSVRYVDDDAAMGGVHLATFAFKNESASPCTLMGYPVFQLLNKSGRVLPHGRAINSQKLPSDEAKVPPQLVTIEPGKEAGFRVYYNSGGAGYLGKPCPTSSKVWISAPGTTRRFMLKQKIQSCTTVNVSSIRSGVIE
jgi:hypothetical protein